MRRRSASNSKNKGRGLAAALLAAGAGCADPAALPPVQRGAGVYATYKCAQCHRIGNSGGDTGPDLSFVGFRKSEAFLDLWLKNPRAWQPSTLMPDFHLRDDARAALAAYLATLKGSAHREGPAPWDAGKLRSDPVRRGAEIYRRAGCVTCHGEGGKGGYKNNNVPGGEIPRVDTARQGFSKKELIERITLGVPRPEREDPNLPAPMLNMPAWGETLKPDEIEAVADYLLSLSSNIPDEEW